MMDREVRDALWMNLRVEMSRHDAKMLNELIAEERDEARSDRMAAVASERERVLCELIDDMQTWDVGPDVRSRALVRNVNLFIERIRGAQ